MTTMTISKRLLDELLSGVEQPEDLLGDKCLMKELKVRLLVRLMERMLGAELTEHLGYEPHCEPASQQTNRRNGTTRKTLKDNDGIVPIDIPRDRPSHRNCVSTVGQWTAALNRNRSRKARPGSTAWMTVRRIRKQSGGLFSRRTIGLYEAGFSTCDIWAHLEEVYGLTVSADLISRVTDAVLEEVSDWQNRALEPIYPIVFLDALHVKIRDAQSRQVKNHPVYVAPGVTTEGEREVPGLWIANTEGAKFWLSVMNNLRNIRHCRSDKRRKMAHRRRHPDRRRPLLSYELSSSCAKLE
jgi:transposase-like protein